MSEAEEQVDIEHLVAAAVQPAGLPLTADPLPSPHEIEAAKQAAAAAAHSTCSAAVGARAPKVKGLGGAGLNPKRRGGGRGEGNGSTISAATAPPMLAGTKGRPAQTPASKSGLGGGGNNDDGPAAAGPGAADAGSSGSASAGSRPALSNSSKAGVRSFRTVLSPESCEEGSDNSGGTWESASTEEVQVQGSKQPRLASSSSSVSQLLEDWFEPSTLAACGMVLAACAGSLLVLGAAAYASARRG